MKKAILKRLAKLNTGVIGKLIIDDLVLHTIETDNCLEPGVYDVTKKDGRYFIGEDYPILMDKNGQFRSNGLVMGLEWAFNSFDVNKKGDAIQALLKNGADIKVEVLDLEDDGLDGLLAVEKENEKLVAEKKALEKELEAVSEVCEAEHREQVDALKSALMWSVTQWGVKPAKAKEANKVIDKVLNEGIEDESNRDDSGVKVQTGKQKGA